jgi:hypothetical protein
MSLEDQAYSQRLDNVIERKYNNALGNVFSKLWSGAKQLASSKFGKWALITGLVIVASTALMFGFGASMGEIAIRTAPNMFSPMGATVMATTEQGLMMGAAKGLQFLLHPAGLMTMTAAGTVASYLDTKNKMTPDQAQQLARQYELSRQRGHQLQQEQAKPAPEAEHPPVQPQQAAPQVQRPTQPQQPAATQPPAQPQQTAQPQQAAPQVQVIVQVQQPATVEVKQPGKHAQKVRVQVNPPATEQKALPTASETNKDGYVAAELSRRTRRQAAQAVTTDQRQTG